LILLMPFGRGRWIRLQESGGPPPFELSLKVQGDIAHNQNSGFELVLRQRPDRNVRRVADHLHASIGIDAPERFQNQEKLLG
jgi:hypothetical protein